MKKINIFAIIFLGLFLVSFTSAFDWANGITAYYKLDETSGTSVLNSQGNATLDLSTDMTVNQPGKIGTAYLSNGIMNSLNFSTGYLDANFYAGNFSISLWFNAKDKTWGDTLFWGGTRDNAIYFDGTNAYANFYNGTSYNAVTSPISLDTWYHIVLTRSKTEGFKIYLNGQLNASNSFTGNGNPTDPFSQFGNRGGFANSLNGTIDEIGIWNRTLSETEVDELWNSGSGLNFGSSGITQNLADNYIIYETNVTSIYLNCTASSSNYLHNVTIFENSSGNWISTTTDISDMNLLNYTFYKPITLGSTLTNISWFCSAINNESVSFLTTNRTLTVSPIIFTACNSSYATKFLNISFKDESDFSNINATIPLSTFEYYIGDGSVTKTYSFSNNSLNYYYTFCAYPNVTFYVNPYVQYKQGTDYPQRIWDATASAYTNSTTNKVLYLLNSINGIYVTFQVLNVADQTLSGVSVLAQRTIESVLTIMGQGITGADGSVTLWLNPDFIHDFSFSKSGFTTYNTSFAPTQTSYTITLSGGTSVNESYFKGINYYLTPTNISLVNDTTYSFGFLLTSSFWDVDDYGFNLRLANGTIITGDSTGTEGTQLSLNYNTSNLTKIYMDYYWQVDGNYVNGTRVWIIYNTDKTQWSIKNFRDDLILYLDSGIFGLDEFGRYVIIFLVLFMTVGIVSYKFGATSPMAIFTIIFLVVFFLDAVIGIMPTLINFSGYEVPYLLTFLTGLILLIVIMREVSR